MGRIGWATAVAGLLLALVTANAAPSGAEVPPTGSAALVGAPGVEPGPHGESAELSEGDIRMAALAPSGSAAGTPTRRGGSMPPPSGIERAWSAPAGSLEERVTRTRRTALELGAWNLDPAARAVVTGAAGGDQLARARAAVRLAPDLPVASMALAEALWLHGESPMGAVRALVGALGAIPRHLEASLWFAGSGLYMLAVALLGGGLIAIFIAGLAVAAHAAHDLGHLISRNTPEFARFALLGGLLLVPLILGEGVLGFALAFLVVAVVYGSRGQRIALAIAVAAVWAGAFPVAQLAGATLNAFPADPVARATYSAGSGLASPVEVARLEAAAASDPLAARGLAIHTRRVGNLARADALYQELLGQAPDDLGIVNNAANVRLDLGQLENALELYARAGELAQSPVVLFNLAQAHGRAFQVEDLNRTLALAQRVDGELVAEFTALQGAEAEGFVVDLPLPPRLMWERVLRSDTGAPIAAELRAPLAPGRIGGNRDTLAAACAGVLLFGIVVGWRLQPSRWCGRCGQRMCPRCAPESSGGELCDGCNRLFYQPEKTDRALRLDRVSALREREQRVNRLATAASLLIPGAAGLLARRPFSSFLGAFFFALAVSAIVWNGGVIPDPLIAGGAGTLCFATLAVLSLLLYSAIVGLALAARRNR